MRSRMLIAGVPTMALALMAAGCGGSSSGAGGGDGGSGGDDDHSIGIVQFSSSDETSERVVQGYVEYADDQGWEYSKVDPQGSVDKAISAMNDFVQKGVDAIVVSVFPSETLTAGIRATSQGAGTSWSSASRPAFRASDARRR
jgi:ribose transport system substrate-binding protein